MVERQYIEIFELARENMERQKEKSEWIKDYIKDDVGIIRKMWEKDCCNYDE